MKHEMRAVFADNEGCLIHGKGLRFRNGRLDQLQRWLHGHPELHFALATGRSVPYVEAMTQVLGLTHPAHRHPPVGRIEVPSICETGAALYWPWRDTYEVLGQLPDTGPLLDHLGKVPYRVELGKVACLSLYPEGGLTVTGLEEAVRGYPGIQQFEVSASKAAVDITPRGVHKGTAVMHVSKLLGFQKEEILCIGDSGNDLSMRPAAGFFACPSNASEACKEAADYCSPYPATKGILDILQHFSD